MKKSFNPNLNTHVNIHDISLIKYIGCIPSLIYYQAVTKLFLMIVSTALKTAASLIVSSTNMQVITNMDIPYLFTSFRGLLLLLLGLSIIVFYTILDINCMILIADNFLHQRKKKVLDILIESVLSIRYLLHPKGLLVVLFVSVIAPLTFTFYGISLTKSFYIPDFVMSVITSTMGYHILYYALYIIFTLCGFFYLFTMHFMVLRHVKVHVAMYTARLTMQKYYKNFLKRYSLFLIKTCLICLLVVFLFVIVPGTTYYVIANHTYNHFWLSFLGLQSLLVFYMIKTVFIPFQFMELNRIYESYTEEDEGDLIPPDHVFQKKFLCGVGVTYAGLFGLSTLCMQDDMFNSLFPTYNVNDVIAHRAGGTLANENTLLGLKAAIARGVQGSEIDVQRTKDGHYIIYHDNTFQRLCGVNKKVEDLTLKECKQLDVINSFSLTEPTTKLATLEQMMDTAKGKIHLYIELKGKSADAQMAEDVYQMAKDRDMLDQVTFISLKYDVISGLETNHPDAITGYLCYVSLGDISKINCDVLLLEDEMATPTVIDEAHLAGKKVYIWTINSDSSMRKRMTDNSDGVITDYIDLAQLEHNLLENRSDFTRVVDYLIENL